MAGGRTEGAAEERADARQAVRTARRGKARPPRPLWRTAKQFLK